ncbi:hypothetical protein QEG73_00875 [Chitinophagaceae bacterium 26-R-25]|nr:hypothetical protein [Chitinophagaceae bacterium 26-R-25]
MEKPYKGRATIQDNFTDLQITIPAKRNWFTIIFLAVWLGGWLTGEIFALVMVTGLFGKNPAGFFILFWLVGWTVGGFFAFRTFIWNVMGKEIITVGQGQLMVAKKGAFFFKPKDYDLNEVKNIRVKDDTSGFDGLFSGQRSEFWLFNNGGVIRFDYGLQTIKIAGGIDEAEAKFIISKLKDQHVLTERNYS